MDVHTIATALKTEGHRYERTHRHLSIVICTRDHCVAEKLCPSRRPTDYWSLQFWSSHDRGHSTVKCPFQTLSRRLFLAHFILPLLDEAEPGDGEIIQAEASRSQR